jgi:hypothetical protein
MPKPILSKTTLTVFNQPPDFGNEFNQPGTWQNNINGKAKANEIRTFL